MIKEKGPGGSIAIETELDPSQSKTDSLVGIIVTDINKPPKTFSKLDLKVKIIPNVLGSKEIIKK